MNRHTLIFCGLLLGLVIVLPKPDISVADEASASQAKAKPDVSKIYGKIMYVNSFPDYKVQIVNSFPDFKVQIVNSFPDFKVQYVNSFPGVP